MRVLVYVWVCVRERERQRERERDRERKRERKKERPTNPRVAEYYGRKKKTGRKNKSQKMILHKEHEKRVDAREKDRQDVKKIKTKKKQTEERRKKAYKRTDYTAKWSNIFSDFLVWTIDPYCQKKPLNILQSDACHSPRQILKCARQQIKDFAKFQKLNLLSPPLLFFSPQI